MAFCLLFPLLSIEISADSTESEKIERLCRFGQNLPLFKSMSSIIIVKRLHYSYEYISTNWHVILCIHLNLHILFF